ncbi:GNAT N-acetyltransferase [Paenibacillus barcinonensis]|uniref:Acetyltransferase (GNAT) family protein n=1 Tax=Paenibacillus barcinonensis TaxID=198119 RepID=A0A2V4UWI4_PAEBA|nr:GNAT family N-acetyltransferase [Paenibacillus barcinonensis]PYE44423.1 acetyltransferase (GNAT) family protein [Paenibacillus barcinonensis]QKS58077.1 GNAT N-acetyltransferase [Paenibacillus barcinonensis]
MIIHQQEYEVKGVTYTIRSAEAKDAGILCTLRVQLDGETEHMDREAGEAFIDERGFEELIHMDAEKSTNLFLVAEVSGRVVAYSRCAGSELKRFKHQVEFGVCVARAFWGYGIGKALLKLCLDWADRNAIEKVTLKVLATNEKAIRLYELNGFEIEGILKRDRRHADGQYYDTIIMGRLAEGAL